MLNKNKIAVVVLVAMIIAVLAIGCGIVIGANAWGKANVNHYEYEPTPIIYDVKEENVVEQETEDIGYVDYDVPESTGFKSFMDYRTITDETSMQYVLQNDYSYTGDYGIMMVGDRYCVALGSYFTSDIGQYVDLILENGTVIPCILADQKADIHTDENNIITVASNCMSEFVVNTDYLDNIVKTYGDISRVDEMWDSPVKEVRVYDRNIFYE